MDSCESLPSPRTALLDQEQFFATLGVIPANKKRANP